MLLRLPKLCFGPLVAVFCLFFSLTTFGGPSPYDRNSHQGEGWNPNVHLASTARESPYHSGPTPDWTNTFGFEKDVWSFARVRWTRQSRWGQVWWNGGYWYSDYPDSDLNLSFRVHQLTSLKVNPNGRVIDLTDPELFDYPFIYMVETGLMILEDAEVPILRKYLLNGGFLMTDDCWGKPQYGNFERQIKRALPEAQFVELEMDHPIFHSVYDLRVPKSQLQIPNVMIGRTADLTGRTWEIHEGEVCKDIHFRGVFDSKNRLMVLGCYNTDNGDGWEREGEDVYFFHRFSENIAYPLGINIITYTMTH